MNLNLSDFIGEIYETIYQPDSWTEVIAKLCELMKASSAGLFIHNKKTNDYDLLASYGLNLAIENSYDVGLVRYDYGYKVMQSKPVGKGMNVLSYEDVKYEQPNYTNLLMKPNGISHIAGLTVIKNEEHFVGIKVHRGEDSHNFEPEALEILTTLHPHFERALRLYWQFRQMDHDGHQIRSALSKMSLGVMIVNRDHQVQFKNPIASKILKNHGGLEIQGGLKAYYENENHSLRKIVDEFFSASNQARNLKAQAIGLHDPNKNTPLILILTPNSLPDLNETKECEGLTIYLSDPESAINIKEETLCRVHGLTMAEASIAISIANGLTLKEVSEINSTSIGTVRTQLKQIFNKTGVTRQQDLIRLLISGAYNLNIAN